MSGRDATKQLMAVASREEFVDVSMVARALGASRKSVLRDWRRRQFPETNIGREVRLSADLVLTTYFPHRAQNSPSL